MGFLLQSLAEISKHEKWNETQKLSKVSPLDDVINSSEAKNLTTLSVQP